MREIKFRAHRFGVVGQVVEIRFISPEKGYDYLIQDLNGNQLREWGKNLDIMQHTGMKDKNGTEIYEGDILMLPGIVFLTYPSKAVIGVVKYIKNEFYIDVPGYAYDFNKMVIIGNIYENPELLEENN